MARRSMITALLAVAVVASLVALLLTGTRQRAAAQVSAGTTELLSVGAQAARPGDLVDSVALSADGRYAAFDDRAVLDPLDGTNDYEGTDQDVYVRDRQAPGRTVLISRGGPVEPPGSTGPSGSGAVESAANGSSTSPALSATGRYVAFDTSARNLPVANPLDPAYDDGVKVVVCDRDPDGDGVFDERTDSGALDFRYVLVGRATSEADPSIDNVRPALSAEATTIAWTQWPRSPYAVPSTIVATLGRDETGALTAPDPSGFRTLLPTDAGEVGGGRGAPEVSADGGHVVFPVQLCGYCGTSLARPPLVSLSGARQVFGDREAYYVADLATGRTARLDVDDAGVELGDGAESATVSGDGRVVAFAIWDDTSEVRDYLAYALDRDPDGDGLLWPDQGEPRRTTVVSRTTAGEPAEGRAPAVSADGRYVALVSGDTGMHNGGDTFRGDGPPYDQIVVRDLVVDASREQAQLPRLPGELASPGSGRDCGAPAGTACGADGDSAAPALSADGGVVAFVSPADDLVAGTADPPPESSDAYARRFAPALRADPVDFGTVGQGTPVTRTVLLSHTGFGPLRIAGVTVAGGASADFAVFPAENCVAATLHETDTCLVSVRFTPGAEGERSAQLVVDLGGTRTSVALTGTVDPVAGPPAAGSLTAAPGLLAFPGDRLALSDSPQATIVVRNPGGTPVVVGAVTAVSGPALFPQDYRFSTGCAGAILAPGASCRIDVVASPRGAGDRPGALLITGDAASGPLLVGLTARGRAATVTANPAVVVAGRVAQLSGTGFPAGLPVPVLVPGRAEPLVLPADANGAFATSMLVFEHTAIGTTLITATAPGTELTASAALLVVAGTYQPPGFLGRH